MRIVFMGTPDFAVASLERLIESDYELAAVVTQPDRPAGRGQKIAPPPVKVAAEKAGLPVLQPESLKEPAFHAALRELAPDALAVVAFRVLPNDVLEIPKLGAVNVHASLLPKYRGAAPVQWALINGERETGVTIFKLDVGVDTGGILGQKKVDILDDDDALSLANMLSVVGADLLIETLAEAESKGGFFGQPQDNAQATKAPKLKKEDGHLDFSQRGEQIICRMRGVTPWPGAYSLLGGKPWRILAAEPQPPDQYISDSKKKPQPGEILGFVKGIGVVVRAGDGELLVTKIQPPGKRAMGAFDCINGGLLKVGQCLT
jgi:methionyl-tRNA formyltransferase